MARTYQSGGDGAARGAATALLQTAGPAPGAQEARLPVREPGVRILRGVGIILLCAVVAGVAFAAGGYLGFDPERRSVGRASKRRDAPDVHILRTAWRQRGLAACDRDDLRGSEPKDRQQGGDADLPAQRARRQGRRALHGARRCGLVGDHAGAMGGHPGRRDRRGGEHDNPAVRQERLPHPRPDVAAQDQGSPHRHRVGAQERGQRPDPRRLPEHRVLRQQRLRCPGGLRDLLQQVR